MAVVVDVQELLRKHQLAKSARFEPMEQTTQPLLSATDATPPTPPPPPPATTLFAASLAPTSATEQRMLLSPPTVPTTTTTTTTTTRMPPSPVGACTACATWNEKYLREMDAHCATANLLQSMQVEAIAERNRLTSKLHGDAAKYARVIQRLEEALEEATYSSSSSSSSSIIAPKHGKF